MADRLGGPGQRDSRGDADYSPTRAPCNTATGQTTACLNVRYAESTDCGKSFSPSIQITDRPTNPSYEQFGGRLVPFFGDYITVAAQGDTIGAVWTDQRNTAGAADTTGDNDGADVAGDPETGGSCTLVGYHLLRRNRRSRPEHLHRDDHTVAAAPHRQPGCENRRPCQRVRELAQSGSRSCA